MTEFQREPPGRHRDVGREGGLIIQRPSEVEILGFVADSRAHNNLREVGWYYCGGFGGRLCKIKTAPQMGCRFYLAEREGFVLEFCEAVCANRSCMPRKILRSPLQTVPRTVCLTLRSNPSGKSKRSKNGIPNGMPFLLGGKGGIRSRLRPRSGSALTATGSHSLPTRSNPLDPHKKTKTAPQMGCRFYLASCTDLDIGLK